jgi:hypothetical protein
VDSNQLLRTFRHWAFGKGAGPRVRSSLEINRYAADGLVIPACRVPEQDLLELEDALSEVFQSSPDDVPDRFPHLLRATRFTGTIVRFAQTPEILNVVEQLIGSDIALWGAGIFGKPPIRGKATPWHQDAAFLEYQAIRPLELCTAWVALDDSTAENGCVRYIPGSHRARTIYSHGVCENQSLTLDRELKDYVWSDSDIQCAALMRGQLSIHHAYLIHGSEPNYSGRRRAGIALRYMPTTSCYDYEFAKRSSAPERAIYLVRGIDRSGANHLLSPPSSFAPRKSQ